MSILIDHETRVCLQGITGSMDAFKPRRCGDTILPSPGFALVAVAVRSAVCGFRHRFARHRRDRRRTVAHFRRCSARQGRDSRGHRCGIRLVVCVAEFMPLQDVIVVLRRTRETGTRLIGPNCSGLISPGKAKAGFYCDDVCMPGDVGVIAKSGTLSYAVLVEMKRHGLGASTVVGVGGDEMKGTTFRDGIELFEQDPDTRSIFLIGEVGGRDEEQAAAYIAEKGSSKPVEGFVAGADDTAGPLD